MFAFSRFFNLPQTQFQHLTALPDLPYAYSLAYIINNFFRIVAFVNLHETYHIHVNVQQVYHITIT